RDRGVRRESRYEHCTTTIYAARRRRIVGRRAAGIRYTGLSNPTSALDHRVSAWRVMAITKRRFPSLRDFWKGLMAWMALGGSRTARHRVWLSLGRLSQLRNRRRSQAKGLLRKSSWCEFLHQPARPAGCAGSPLCDPRVVFGAGICRSRRVDELWREPQ